MKVRNFIRNIIIYAAAGALFGCGMSTENSHLKEEWDYFNQPEILMDNYETVLKELPLSAKLEVMPWTDSYWPTTRRGIADRWQNDDYTNDVEVPYTKQDIVDGKVDLNLDLSPIEKYDLYLGDYHFPRTREELQRTDREAQGWEGLCHGWAAASLVYHEPNTITVANPDGLEITFTSSDIKALLTDKFANNGGRSFMLGQRCYEDMDENPNTADFPACKDVNAGSFHLVLTNYVGIMKLGFIADITRDLQVWNHPVYGYETSMELQAEVYEGAAPGTANIYRVKTRMDYITEIGARPEPIGEANRGQVRAARYEYDLEVDQAGAIIGGRWVTEKRPDFLWIQFPTNFNGNYAPLSDLYRLATTVD